MLDFTVDASLCTRCKECVRDCPARVISLPKGGLPEVAPESEQNCIGCQHCLAICPTGAISILGKHPADSRPLDTAEWPDADSMEQLVRGRRTMRRYKPEDVEPDLIQRLLESAAHAPTGANRCALTFTVIDDRESMESIRQRVMEALQSAAEAESVPEHFGYLLAAVPAFFKYRADLIFRGAPHLLIVSASPQALCPDQDIAIALSTFELLAASSGLGTTWCGMLNMAVECVPELRSLLGIPQGHRYYGMLFGKPGATYARTVQRADSATITHLKPSGETNK